MFQALVCYCGTVVKSQKWTIYYSMSEVICVKEQTVFYSAQNCEIPKHKNTFSPYFTTLLHPHPCAINKILNTPKHIQFLDPYELFALG